MIYEILEYYKEINFYDLITKHIAKKSLIMLFLLLVISITVIIGITFFFKKYFLLFSLSVPILCAAVYLGRQYNITMCKNHDVKPTGLFSVNYTVYYKRQERLLDFLTSKGLDNPDSLKELISMAKIEANKDNKIFIKTGVLATLFVPVWIEFNKWIFSQANNPNEAIIYFYLLSLLSMLIWIAVFFQICLLMILRTLLIKILIFYYANLRKLACNYRRIKYFKTLNIERKFKEHMFLFLSVIIITNLITFKR